MPTEVIVVGGGTVGAAIAFGLSRRGLRVLLLDGDDTDHRAARANFGLVWLHGKGANMPEYQALTGRSVDLWPEFSRELTSVTGTDLQYEKNGGLNFCLGEAAFEARALQLQRLHNQPGSQAGWEMLDRASLQKLLPRVVLGAEVVGASFGHRDGHTNPMRLLAALQTGFQRNGGDLRSNSRVSAITPHATGFTVEVGNERFHAPKLVLAAGLGTPALARQVGLNVPLRPQRGQILVTERLAPMLPLPASGLRQTGEGTIMIGATQEEVGFDNSTTTKAASGLASKTIRTVPALASANLVRQWAGLRVMTPDSYPIYAQSTEYPGAYVALCHSGVTLAAMHAQDFAGIVASGDLPADYEIFHQRRFDVSQAA